MAHTRGFSQGRTRSRRQTGWEEGPGTLTVHTPSSSSALILGNGQEALVDGQTIIRLRGYVELVLETAAAAGDGFTGAFGIGIASAPAFAVGITAVPTPITELEWEGWMWHQIFSVHSGVSSRDRVAFEIDSKAMRKIGTDEVIYAAWEGTESGTVTSSIALGTRMLVKLP